MVGRTQKNLWFAYGYTGHGLNMANTMGNVIAQAIGSETDLFEKFASMPTLSLPFGQCGRAGIMSLAMMYYRLRDAG